MDASDDVMLCSQANIRGTGKGCINSPNILRSSRSLEHRAPTDAALRLYPSFRDENNLVALEPHLEEESISSSSSNVVDGGEEIDVLGDSSGNTTTTGNSCRRMGATESPEGQVVSSSPVVTSPPPTERRKPLALKYATQLSGRDLLADFRFKERKEAEKKHIIMLL